MIIELSNLETTRYNQAYTFVLFNKMISLNTKKSLETPFKKLAF